MPNDEAGTGPQNVSIVAWQSIYRIVAALLATAALLWVLWQIRPLIGMILLSVFFALALEPGVRWLTSRYQWRRGAAFGVIYGAGLLFLIVMVVVLIPALSALAEEVEVSGPAWVAQLNELGNDYLGVIIIDPAIAEGGSEEVFVFVAGWVDDSFGGIGGIASAGAAFVFSLSAMAMFTFYFVADSDRIIRKVLSWFKPESQQRIGWTLDEAIVQTGGYFYSRTLLMLINGTGFFLTMVLVGIPAALSLPLAVFGGFVSVFIPVLGTYLGAAIPILVTLAIEGLGAALILLGYVLIYQLLENTWLSPRLSAQTMSLTGGTAFVAALAGGSLAGPIGAFLALPTAALISSFVTNYANTYDVVYRSEAEKEPDGAG